MALLPRKNTFDIDVSEDVPREAFLGTLRSELDEDTPLEGAFAELYARFVSLRDAYDTGRVDTRSYGRALRDLRVIDPEGFQWTIGATTGRWYRRNYQEGGQWSSSPAPSGTGTLIDHTGKESGWAVEDWEERRAKRLQAEAEKARAEEIIRETAPTSKKKMTIDEMFDKYVEVSEEEPTYSVNETILVVDDLPESPDSVLTTTDEGQGQ
jgi:hypothetical protein